MCAAHTVPTLALSQQPRNAVCTAVTTAMIDVAHTQHSTTPWKTLGTSKLYMNLQLLLLLLDNLGRLTDNVEYSASML